MVRLPTGLKGTRRSEDIALVIVAISIWTYKYHKGLMDDLASFPYTTTHHAFGQTSST